MSLPKVALLKEQNAYLAGAFFESGLKVHAEDAIILGYGSAVRSEMNSSDYDMLIATRDPVANTTQEEVTRALVDFHIRAERDVDVEVPYKNKLFYTYQELNSALELQMFRGPEGVRPLNGMEEGDAYFSSKEMKLRLALNALTTESSAMPGSDHKILNNFMNLGERSIGNLVDIVARRDFSSSGESVTARWTATKLVGDRGQAEGIDFLGYDFSDKRFWALCVDYAKNSTRSIR